MADVANDAAMRRVAVIVQMIRRQRSRLQPGGRAEHEQDEYRAANSSALQHLTRLYRTAIAA